MAMGVGSLSVDLRTNKKLARVSRGEHPLFIIQLDTEILHIWAETSQVVSLKFKGASLLRSFGYNAFGEPARPGQPGMHSGLRPFFSTNELTCFNPATLDEAWLLICDL
jgi:hypothetical protein